MVEKNKKSTRIKARVKYLLSFFLIIFLFQKHSKEEYLERKLSVLSSYKKKLITIVKQKQEKLRSIYSNNKNLETLKISDLFISCAFVKITENNFCEVNSQMDQIGSIIIFNNTYKKIKKEYKSTMWSYNDEIKLTAQYYYSLLGSIKFKYSKYPWKYLLQIVDLSSFEITL